MKILPMNGYRTTPIIIGSESHLIPLEDREIPDLSHTWRCYVKGPPSIIKAVQFRLHESFKTPYITVTEAPFEITERGWGEFTIQIKITLYNDEKLNTNHYLKLHGDSYPVVSEKTDTIAYKGKPAKPEEEISAVYENDDAELEKINNAITYMLDLFEKSATE
jgi:YEATS domain-containing protein 4